MACSIDFISRLPRPKKQLDTVCIANGDGPVKSGGDKRYAHRPSSKHRDQSHARSAWGRIWQPDALKIAKALSIMILHGTTPGLAPQG
jgi:hypothetical protein